MDKHAIRARYYAALADGYSQADAVRIANGRDVEVIDVAGFGEPQDDTGMTDAELREAIRVATGTAPHHRTGRDKLLAQYAALSEG